MTQCHNASASQGLHFFLSLSLIVELEDARLHAEEEEAKDSSRDDGSCGMISLFCIATLFEGSFTQRYCNHIHFRCSPGSRCCRWYNKPELSRQRTGWIGRGGWGWNKPVTCKSVNKGLNVMMRQWKGITWPLSSVWMTTPGSSEETKQEKLSPGAPNSSKKGTHCKLGG